MSAELIIEEFLKYLLIESIGICTDGSSIECGSTRGDGWCALWAVLVGWSLLERSKLFKNPDYIDDKFKEYTEGVKPLTMEILIQILLDVSKRLLSMMGTRGTITIDDHFEFTRDDLVWMNIQLDLSFDGIQTLHGIAHFQILSLLLGVEIQILNININERSIDCIGNKDNDTIRISTGYNHFHLHNNKHGTDLSFYTDIFWKLQWVGHPHLSKSPTPFISHVEDSKY